jgi:hypothetical protein
MSENAPTFFAETPADVAEFDAVASGAAPEAPAETPAPEPVAKAEPEAPKAEPAKAEPEKAEPAKDERPKFVPHAALHEERLKRQALEKEIAELRAGKQPESEKPAEIDEETDPIAALKEVRAHIAKQREETEQQNQLRAFDSRVQAHESDFAAATPDYGDAVAFLREARATQIKAAAEALGKVITPQDIGAILLHEARTTSHEALTNGRNPGEVFYTLAKSFGYTGKKAAEPAPTPQPEPTPAPQVLPTKEAEATIDRITRGQRASNKAGGGEAPDSGEVTLESLARLDGAAFDAAFAKFSKSQRAAH